MIKGDVQKRGMLYFVVDALRRELRDVDDTTRSFDDFFFFLRRKEDRSNYLFIYLFFRLIFYFSLLNYLYMYMYMYFFFPPFFGKRGDSRFSQERAGDYVPSLLDAQMLLLYFPRFQCQLISLSLSFSFALYTYISQCSVSLSVSFCLSLSFLFIHTLTHRYIYIYLCIRGAQLPTSCLCRSSEKGSGNVTSNSR